MRRTQFVVHQILNTVQIQHHAGAACTAAREKKGARVFEAKGNQVSDNLEYDLCSHEREHVIGRLDGSTAAPTVARAVRNQTAKRILLRKDP